MIARGHDSLRTGTTSRPTATPPISAPSGYGGIAVSRTRPRRCHPAVSTNHLFSLKDPTPFTSTPTVVRAADRSLRYCTPCWHCSARFATALDDAAQCSAKVTPFRVMAATAAEGQPAPEGLHRDGVTLVTALPVGRHNAVDGQGTVVDTMGNTLLTTMLREPGILLLGGLRDPARCLTHPAGRPDRHRPPRCARDYVRCSVRAMRSSTNPVRSPCRAAEAR